MSVDAERLIELERKVEALRVERDDALAEVKQLREKNETLAMKVVVLDETKEYLQADLDDALDTGCMWCRGPD